MHHAPPPTPRTPLANRAIVAVFLAVVTLPLVVTMVQLARGPGTDREEQLARTPPPPTSLRSALSWPGAFKWYFEQRFGLRPELVRLHGLAKVEGLGVTANRDVLLGRDEWLYLASERVLDYHRHAEPFSYAELTDWVRTLEERRAWLAERGISYLVVIAPDKHGIYPEHLPGALAPAAEVKRLGQLATAVAERTGVELVDLRPTLRDALGTGRLYHRTDTHWNLLGGWHGARAVIDRLGPAHAHDALAATPGPVEETAVGGGDLARLLGLAADTTEIDVAPASTPRHLSGPDGEPVGWTALDVLSRDEVVIETGREGPRAVILRDSFGEALVPWLSQAFSRTVWKWTYGFDRELIERESPNVVIQQLVERKLMTIAPDGELVEDRP